MRKITAGLFMSLDGVVETPERWGFQYFTEGLNKIIAQGLAEADAVLLGPQLIISLPKFGRHKATRCRWPRF